MMSSRDDVRALYRRRAKRYDSATQLYRLMGFPLKRYRAMAVEALGLSAGDTVVEVGCGTGANLGALREAVGERGRVVGVDLTPEMLEAARRKVSQRGWRNVELVRADAASYPFPPNVAAILSTFALTLVPEYDAVVARGAAALRPGGRWVVLDLELPPWPSWLVDVGVALTRPYGVDRDVAHRHAWESVQRHLDHSVMRELYFGAAYLIQGTKARAKIEAGPAQAA